MVLSVSVPSKVPVLFVTDGVCFPGATVRIPVHSKSNLRLVEDCLLEHLSLSRSVVALAYKSPIENDTNDMHGIGTAAIVTQVMGSNWPKITYSLQITGLCRVKLEEFLQTEPYRIAKVTPLDRLNGAPTTELHDAKLLETFEENLEKLLGMIQPTPAIVQLKKVLRSSKPAQICDLTAGIVEVDYSQRLTLLDAVDINERLKLVNKSIEKQLKKLEMLGGEESTKIDIPDRTVRVDQVSKIINNLLNNRNGDRVVRFDLNNKQPRKKDDLEEKIRAAEMPEQVLKMVLNEYTKLCGMAPQSPEYPGLKNYIEFMAELPWNKQTTDSLNTVEARNILDTDHFGLETVKKRVLEFLAVRQLRNSLKGPILCLIGPPGVGKTSIAKSIATTLGRKFHRISVGGISDQSDIRGHRRTYIGSMPGRIIQGLHKVNTNNPVFLLDEVDKMYSGVHGSPKDALLEVLDPEQNSTFVDHYVNAPFDLSNVLFIATANSADYIPYALWDRMEVIHIPGYSPDEHVSIAERHLVPKQVAEHGLTDEHILIPNKALKFIVENYTRQPGVRSLERKLGAICRAVALKVATAQSAETFKNTDSIVENENTKKVQTEFPIVMDETAVENILGAIPFNTRLKEDAYIPGIAPVLFVTGGHHGTINCVEAAAVKGTGKLSLTGQLGSVMQESANVALHWVKTHTAKLLVDPCVVNETNIHIHYPSGSKSKDGPSAGISTVAALVSLFTGKPVRSDTAMTGEISLRGVILPVGGIKAKLLAAHRGGFTRVVIPLQNQKDVKHLPEDVQNELCVIAVQTISEALDEIFEKSEETGVKILSKL